MNNEVVPGPLLAAGRTSQVYQLDGDLAVKLFAPGTSQSAIETEETNCRLVSEAGVPTVTCRGRVRAMGKDGLIFDILRGESLTRMAERQVWRLRAVSRQLATVQLRLHGCTAPGLREIRRVVVELLESPQMDFLTGAERAEAIERVTSLPGGDAVLHLDYHPEDVFVTARGPEVIDWATALRGAPAADVAMTTLLFTSAELFPGTPWAKRVLYGAVRRAMLGWYRSQYRRGSGLTDQAVAQWRVPALVLRLAWWDIAGERERLRDQLRRELIAR